MSLGVRYTVRLQTDSAPVVSDLTAPTCSQEGGDSFTGGVRLLLRQP
jgi:hypothetical protein